jgi:hypothetical protein
VIISLHLAEVGVGKTLGILRRKPDLAEVAGLRYAETTIAAPLSASLLPAPRLGRVGLIAAWDDDAALDRFAANHPLAQRLAGGWQVRLEPLHVYGAWPPLPGLPAGELPLAEDEPVAVLTLGRLRLHRTVGFLRASSRAEGEALADPAMLASTGLARLPRIVATFSLWQSAAAMREYAHGRRAGAHPAAVRAHRANPFHTDSAFIRLRPYASRGSWDGRDPLAATAG